jgi:hypothetical protein
MALYSRRYELFITTDMEPQILQCTQISEDKLPHSESKYWLTVKSMGNKSPKFNSICNFLEKTVV